MLLSLFFSRGRRSGSGGEELEAVSGGFVGWVTSERERLLDAVVCFLLWYVALGRRLCAGVAAVVGAAVVVIGVVAVAAVRLTVVAAVVAVVAAMAVVVV